MNKTACKYIVVESVFGMCVLINSVSSWPQNAFYAYMPIFVYIHLFEEFALSFVLTCIV